MLPPEIDGCLRRVLSQPEIRNNSNFQGSRQFSRGNIRALINSERTALFSRDLVTRAVRRLETRRVAVTAAAAAATAPLAIHLRFDIALCLLLTRLVALLLRLYRQHSTVHVRFGAHWCERPVRLGGRVTSLLLRQFCRCKRRNSARRRQNDERLIANSLFI